MYENISLKNWNNILLFYYSHFFKFLFILERSITNHHSFHIATLIYLLESLGKPDGKQTENKTTEQKIKFSITNFFSKCDQLFSFLQIWSLLLKKPLLKKTSFFVHWTMHFVFRCTSAFRSLEILIAFFIFHVFIILIKIKFNRIHCNFFIYKLNWKTNQIFNLSKVSITTRLVLAVLLW